MATKRVMIVSVREPSFSIAKERLLYANPVSYGSGNADYLAFYRLKPISAISHYGIVSEIESPVRFSKYLKKKPLWLKREHNMKCYHLGWLKKLPSPITRSRKYRAIRRPVYTSLETLLSARTLADIFRG